MNSRRNTSFPTFLGHTRCYVCDNFRHKAKDCKLPYTLKSSRQKMEKTPSRLNNEGNADNNRQSTKV